MSGKKVRRAKPDRKSSQPGIGKFFTRRKFLAGLLAAPATVIGDSIGIEPGWLRVERIRLSANPKHRFVHFTDIHHKGDAAFLERVVGKINAQQPDFVCFTGDLVEDSAFVSEALAIIQKINAPVYGIPGNHDFWADIDFDEARDAFARTGGGWFMDQEQVICDGAIHLFGMSGTEWTHFQPSPGRKNILLAHYPSSIDSIQNARFDLILSGHSHGGQVRLPWYGALIVPFGVGEYQLGMYQTRAGPLYVNAGIGYFYVNVRFCCRPEITVFEV
jgi:uncharacterized protein